MFDQLLYILGTIVIAIVLIYILNYVWKLNRKYDLACFLIGDYIFMIFMFLLLFSPFEQVPSLLSSLFIAELTLALVWVELSKRPELKLMSFVPIVWVFERPESGIPLSILRADDGKQGQLSRPSRFLGIKEASIRYAKFGKHFSFAIDLANIGYEEIMVHEYVIYIDGKRESFVALLLNEKSGERLSLKTQQRHTINLSPFSIKSSGFHKIRIEVLATTVKCSKEVWFYISEDFEKLRYVQMNSLKSLLSPFIKNQLKGS